MSNTIKTLSAGDIVRKALAILHNKLVFVKTINKQYDDRFARSGAKNGGTLLIRNPNQFTVRTGAVMDVQDVVETTQTLTLATQLGVDVNFSSVELTLSMDDFAERILTPAMSRLAAEVDATVIAACYKSVYNHVHSDTAYGTATDLNDVLQARVLVNRGLAPTGDRCALVDSKVSSNIIKAGYNIFNPASEISRQYDTGLVGQVYGFKFYESEMAPTHTNGSRTDTTPTVDTSGGVSFVSATSAIIISAVASAITYAVGDVFTIAGVYAVNPETKATYDHLAQWVVNAVATAASTAITVYVDPTPATSGAKQNCKISTASSASAVVNLTAGGSGAASTAYINSLFYHKDAFTFVSADLEMPDSGWAARKVIDNISMRIWRQGDIVNDKHPCRMDVLFGQKCVRPEWACRMAG